MPQTEKRTYRKTFLTFGLFLLVLTVFRISWYWWLLPPEQPVIEDGVLNLTTWDFQNNRPVTLDGQWKFYANQLTEPHELDQQEQVQSLTVPSNWNHLSSSNDHDYNYGTYRLKILLPKEHPKLFGIKLSNVFSAAKLYVNGEVVGNSGEPGESIQQYRSNHQSQVFIFAVDQQEVDLMIQVANHEFPLSGGITNSLKFGTDQFVLKENNFFLLLQIFLIIIIFLHCVYALLLYLMGQRKKEVLYFFLALFSVGLAFLLEDYQLLLHIIPLEATWALRMEMFFNIGFNLFTALFLRNIYADILHKSYWNWIIGFFCLLLSLYSFLPYPYVSYLFHYHDVLWLVNFSFLGILVLKISFYYDKYANILLFAGASIFSSVFWGSILFSTSFQAPMYPFDIIFALIAFGLFMFKRSILTDQENVQLSDLLKKGNELKNLFLASTSHELQPPLHSMINSTQKVIAQNKHKLQGESIKQLELILATEKHFEVALKDFLDTTQLQDGKIRLQKKAVSLKAIISGIIDLLKYLVEEKDVQIIEKISNDFPSLKADENRLIQILFNLIHNAMKSIEQGKLIIDATKEQQHVHVSVECNGKLSESYTAITQEKVDFGLVICKQLVELHGGKMNAQTDRNKIKFIFTLPISYMSELKQDQPKTRQQKAHADSISTEDSLLMTAGGIRQISEQLAIISGARILVIDDDPLHLKVLKNILSPAYEIITTSNGKKALQRIENEQWDLVIVNARLSNSRLSGYELTKTIRENDSISDLPILLLIARNQSEDILKGFLAGANDYVTIPVDAIELQSRVHALTALKRSIQEHFDMEAAWLHAQIRPHFLFNTLNSIISLSYMDENRMITLLQTFTNYLEKSFQFLETGTLVKLSEEIDFVHSYLYIEKERFGDRIEVEWIMDELDHIYVPSMSIQTLVENGIRHGILQRLSGGKITIQITRKDKEAIIKISDDGVGIPEDKIKDLLNFDTTNSTGIGVINTNQRLLRAFGSELQIESKVNEGTTITFKVPIFSNTEN